MEEISLRVGDRRVDLIQRFRVRRSLNSAVSEADFSIFIDKEREAVYRNAVETPLGIYIDDNQVFSGYIGTLEVVGDSSDGIKYNIDLVSQTQDFFQSQSEETLEFTQGQSISAIASRLVGSIQTENNGAELLNQNITSARTLRIGDTNGRFLDSLMNDYSATLTDNEKGELVVWSIPENAPVVPSIGNILSYNRTTNYLQRYSRTVVLSETDEDDNQVKGEYIDTGRAGRNRVRVIDKSTGLNGITAREYARFASRRMAGAGVSLAVVVSGFLDPNGVPWKRGNTYSFQYDGFDDKFVVTQVIFIGTATGNGNTTELTLTPLDAFINLSRYDGVEDE